MTVLTANVVSLLLGSSEPRAGLAVDLGYNSLRSLLSAASLVLSSTWETKLGAEMREPGSLCWVWLLQTTHITMVTSSLCWVWLLQTTHITMVTVTSTYVTVTSQHLT